MENISTVVVSSVIGGAVASGVMIAIILLALLKKLSKSKQANYAKELKREKELKFITENIKQLNKHLQLESTPISKLLDSFNVDQEQVDNFVLSKKAAKKALREKQIKQATKFKL